MQFQGDPMSAQLHSTDASSGVAVPIYRQGTFTAYTVTARDFLEVHSIEVVAAVGSDVHVFFSTSATPVAGGTIARGTVGTNGGIVRSRLMATGRPGDTIWVIAAAGACDVVLNGSIREVGLGSRPSFKESLSPGQ